MQVLDKPAAGCVSSYPTACYKHTQPLLKREEETREVRKYDLFDSQAVRAPYGSKVLSTHCQRGHICVWLEVNPKEERIERRYFDIVGTGWPIPQGDSRQYVGTVLQYDGEFVWHVYERFA